MTEAVKGCFMKFFDDIKAIKEDKFAQIFIGLFSVIFGLFKSLSEFVYEKDMVNVDIMQSGIYAIICYLSLNTAYWIITRDYNIKSYEIKHPKRLWWVFFAVIMVANIICWMTFGTALISQDNMLIYYWGIKLSCQHPIFYMAFVLLSQNIGIWLGSMLYGVWFYNIVQMLIISSLLAVFLVWVFKQQIPAVLKYLIAAYYILIPLFSLYAMNMEKDPLFSIAVMVMTISLYNIIKQNAKKDWIIFWISVFFVEILRNNGFYMTIGTIAFLLFCYRDMYRNTLIALSIVILAHVGAGMAMKAVGTEQLFQEKIGVPIQQIAATVKNDGLLTEEQKNFINKIMPLENMKKAYNPYASDSIKWAGVKLGYDRDFLESHQKELLKHWLAIMPNNADIYIKAYLKVSIGWWAPYYFKKIDYKSFWSPNRENLKAFAEENDLDINPVLNGKIKEYLEKYYDLSGYFPREGMLFWLLSFSALLYFLKRRSFKEIIIYLPCFLLWLTIMVAAPKARGFRYVLSFAYLLPFFVALLFAEKTSASEKNGLSILLTEKVRKYIKLYANLSVVVFLTGYGLWYFTIGYPIKARIDITTSYNEEPNFFVILNDEKVPEADWMPKFGNRGLVIQQIDKKTEFTVISLQNSDIRITLRGPDEHDEAGNRTEKWVKYTDFRVNGKKILPDSVDTWHDQPFRYVLKAEKNKIYKIRLKWRKK